MSLSLSSSFAIQADLVMPLAQSTTGLSLRVVSQGSGTLGTLTATGFQTSVTWTLSSSTPSWVIYSTDSTGTILTLTFTGAVYQSDPYGFFVSCTDGVTTAYFAIYLEVKSPFVIAANANNTVVTNGTTLNIPSYDSTVADIEIQGLGLYSNVQEGVNFIVPTSLPTGLNFVTSDEDQLILRVSDPQASNLPGGLQLYSTSPVAIPLTIQAYQPGSFYDEPDRAYSLVLSVSSQSQKAGVLDFDLGAYYNNGAGLLQVDAVEINILLGTLQSLGVSVTLPLQYVWTATGTAGLTLNSGGGGTTDTSAAYSISGTGTATISLKITDANGSSVANGLSIVEFNQVSESNTSWLTTSAIKVGVDSNLKSGYTEGTVDVILSSPDGFNSEETVILTLGVKSASSIESALSTPILTNAGPITLSASNPTATVGFQFPSGAAIGNKWVLTITAANSATDPSRTGYAQVLFTCNGLTPLTINGLPDSNTISSSTGTDITPISLTATNTLGASITSVFELVGGSEFGTGVLGAPDGLYIDSQNRISGNALTPGTYKFVVAATATGYSRSYSSVITLTVTQVDIAIQLSSLAASVTSIPDNTSFALTWSASNATVLYLVQVPSAITPIRAVTGTSTISITQVGSNVYTVYGTNYYGVSYSVPVVVISSSIAEGAQLLPSPTIASIDEDYDLTVNWQPYSVDGAYSVYKGWDISLQTPASTGTLTTIVSTGLDNGGTTSARVFKESLVAGTYSMSMTALSNDYTLALDSDPWDSSHVFPTALLAANVTLDNTNLYLGQTLTITLNANYTGADFWQVVFPDNTSTGWLPISSRSVAKSFTISGSLDIVIQTQNNYSTATPSVKLFRQLTQSIYIVDQQYSTSTTEDTLTSTLGIGGEAGFEVVSATTGTSTPQPYDVIVRSVARDTVTNELKLLVATSRFSNASSLLGTMAIDVFPMMGRPHAKDLITPIYMLETSTTTSSIPVTITTSTLPSNSYVGKAMTEFKMQATGGLTDYSWYSEGLPSGLKMNIDGTISGTPTQLGTFDVVFAVMDSSSPAYIAETTLTFTIPTDLVITTTSLPTATVGLSYADYTTSPVSALSFQNTGGLPPYTWTIAAGSVPIGITLSTAGIISGVPCTYNSTTDFSKTFTFTVQVTDAIGAKVSKNYSIGLEPASLSFGAVNQPVIIGEEPFKLTVPVYGGQSPYTLTNFIDDGVVDTGLGISSPLQIAVPAGVVPDALEITTTDTVFYPAYYPNNIALTLAATGGVPTTAGLPTVESYKFYIDANGTNTLLGAACYGSLLVASPVADGVYYVALKVVDTVGHIASKNLIITTQQQGVGTYTLSAASLNTNGVTNSSGWSFTLLPNGLPDPVVGSPYAPNISGNTYYCIVLLDNGSIKLNNGTNSPVSFDVTYLNGELPAGMLIYSGNSWFSTAGLDCLILFDNNSANVPTATGSFSFEIPVTGIINSSNVSVSTAQRFSLNVGTSNSSGTSTPVVAVTFYDELYLDLNTLTADSVGSYSWAYPLLAEGGTSPYSFTIQSGTTLPSLSTGVSINSLPAFASAVSTVNTTGSHYDVLVIATDVNGVSSKVVDIPVQVVESTTQAVHILTNNIPTYVYVNRSIPVDTYYIDSDLVSEWSATGLPVGITLTSTVGTRAYLQGTPTEVNATASIEIIATSASFGTTDSSTFSFAVKAQTAVISTPSHIGATAVIGTQYRVVNNNAMISVQYTGFQPADASLPLLQNTLGSATLGAPGLLINSQASTGNSNITSDGFTMSYDYLPTGAGTDTLTFNNDAFSDSVTLTETYSALVATGSTISYNISEYTVTQTMAAPVQISGGKSPYTVDVTAVSDSRFVPINNNTASVFLQATIDLFSPSTTPYACSVSMTVTDSAGNSIAVTGVLQITVVAQEYITVAFSNYTWNISLSSLVTRSGSIILNSLMSTPQLGHSPYSYSITSVTLPIGLGTFIQVSSSKRVLAFNLTDASISVNDVGADLIANGIIMDVTSTTVAPAPGTYDISVSLQVTDSDGYSSSGTGIVYVNISS